jgi:cytochrome c-type biogenesis protein CcmH
MMTALLLFAPAALAAAAAAWWIARAYARSGPGVVKTAPILIGCAIASVLALGLYVVLGRPDLADEPFNRRIAELEERARTDPTSLTVGEALALLETRAKRDRNDSRPLLFAGQIYASEGRDAEAQRAYREALERTPDSAEAMIGLGRSITAEEGVVSPRAAALFLEAAKRAPENPIPWLYQALAASQGDRYADAAKLWPEVLKRLSPDDPRRQMAEAMLAEAKRKGRSRRTPDVTARKG